MIATSPEVQTTVMPTREFLTVTSTGEWTAPATATSSGQQIVIFTQAQGVRTLAGEQTAISPEAGAVTLIGIRL